MRKPTSERKLWSGMGEMVEDRTNRGGIAIWNVGNRQTGICGAAHGKSGCLMICFTTSLGNLMCFYSLKQTSFLKAHVKTKYYWRILSLIWEASMGVAAGARARKEGGGPHRGVEGGHPKALQTLKHQKQNQHCWQQDSNLEPKI